MKMKDMGIVTGGAAEAQPLIVGKDTVYVHTDIEPYAPDDGEPAELYRYHEIQYGKDEYIQLLVEKLEAIALSDGGA